MRTSLILAAACSISAAAWAQSPSTAPTGTHKRIQLTDQFYSEGAHFADFNKDGKMDIVAGPYWYAGPDFQKKFEIHAVKAFDPKGYSQNFLTYTGDFNGDGWPDVFEVPFPGAAGYWYENPAGKEGPWKQHLAFKVVDNESPLMADVNGDGRQDLVFNTGGQLGYATYDPAKPDEPWTFVPVTPKGGYARFTHGIGAADINGDGRVDIIEAGGWWEQPANAKPGDMWVKHAQKFAPAACQMYGYDVDGDGLTDVITVMQCHQYGLSWYRQVKDEKGEITWKQNVILPEKPDLKAPGLRVSQMHAVVLEDFNGDGLKDILTGKRVWAHGPKGDAEPDFPPQVVWFELKRNPDKTVQFIPHVLDDNSGVGCQVAATDLNGDKVPDVIVGNKRGTFILMSQGK